ANEFLGADLVVNSSYAATQEQLNVAAKLGLKGTQTVEFSTMLSSTAGMELAAVKAATEAYPLVGQLRARAQLNSTAEMNGFPKPGEIRSEEHTSELQSRFDLVCRR